MFRFTTASIVAVSTPVVDAVRRLRGRAKLDLIQAESGGVHLQKALSHAKACGEMGSPSDEEACREKCQILVKRGEIIDFVALQVTGFQDEPDGCFVEGSTCYWKNETKPTLKKEVDFVCIDDNNMDLRSESDFGNDPAANSRAFIASPPYDPSIVAVSTPVVEAVRRLRGRAKLDMEAELANNYKFAGTCADVYINCGQGTKVRFLYRNANTGTSQNPNNPNEEITILFPDGRTTRYKPQESGHFGTISRPSTSLAQYFYVARANDTHDFLVHAKDLEPDAATVGLPASTGASDFQQISMAEQAQPDTSRPVKPVLPPPGLSPEQTESFRSQWMLRGDPRLRAIRRCHKERDTDCKDLNGKTCSQPNFWHLSRTQPGVASCHPPQQRKPKATGCTQDSECTGPGFKRCHESECVECTRDDHCPVNSNCLPNSKCTKPL